MEKGQIIPFKENEQVVHVLSYDEKPGIQAIANTSEDLSRTKITRLLVVITNTSVLELFLCLPELIEQKYIKSTYYVILYE